MYATMTYIYHYLADLFISDMVMRIYQLAYILEYVRGLTFKDFVTMWPNIVVPDRSNSTELYHHFYNKLYEEYHGDVLTFMSMVPRVPICHWISQNDDTLLMPIDSFKLLATYISSVICIGFISDAGIDMDEKLTKAFGKPSDGNFSIMWLLLDANKKKKLAVAIQAYIR